MKGVIFNLLEEIVEDEFGADTWDALLEAAEASGVYTSIGSYDDGEMMGLVAAASAQLNLTQDEVLRWFGSKALPRLAERFDQFFAPHKTSRDLLLTLNNVIHPEVVKLYPGAYTPTFHFSSEDHDTLMMEYSSNRQLCSLAEGFVQGTLAFYKEEADIEHPLCVHRGDASCTFRIKFKSD